MKAVTAWDEWFDNCRVAVVGENRTSFLLLLTLPLSYSLTHLHTYTHSHPLFSLSLSPPYMYGRTSLPIYIHVITTEYCRIKNDNDNSHNCL